MNSQHVFFKVLVRASLFLVPVAFGIYSVTLGQDTNWDLLNYHLYNAYSFLNDRLDVDLAPAGLQTYFNPFLDVAYYSAITSLTPKTFGFFLGLIQGFNFILLYKIATIILKARQHAHYYSIFLALCGVLSVGFLSETGTMLNDSLIAIFPLVSLWLILSKISDVVEGQRGAKLFVFGSGLIMGIGCGLKLVVGIYALGLCLALLLIPLNWNKRVFLSFLFGVAVIAGLAVSGGDWFYTIWREFGNPLFPQYNDIFHGKMAQPLPVRDLRFVPHNLFETFFYPVIFTIDPLRVAELPFKQLSWIVAYIFLLFFLTHRIIIWFRKEKRVSMNPASVLFIGFFCFSYLLWLNIFGIYRYLIPVEVLVPLLIYLVISEFFMVEKVLWGALVFIAALTVVNLRSVPNWGHSHWADTVYSLQGRESISEVAVVYLVGQPLAWIVPALHIKAQFIQLAPNIPLSDYYWQRAESIVKNQNGRRIVVFESEDSELKVRARDGLARLGLAMYENKSGRLDGYIGTRKYEYKFFEVMEADKLR